MKNVTPLVSIIVPAYKTEKYIGKCINSLLKQTYKNIEIIVINDCSPDDLLTVVLRLQKKDSRIRLFLIKKYDNIKLR